MVSVIIPARNEAGNIPQIFSRTPELGADRELIFVEGHSKDGTYAAIEKEIAARRIPTISSSLAPAWGHGLRPLQARHTGAGKAQPRFESHPVNGKEHADED